jgi:hypothetical protein
MQVLLVTGAATITTALATYLPYDKAPVPFGDPLACTFTSSATAVFTVPGYKPTNRDAVSLSITGAGNVISTGGLATTMVQGNVTYYVCSASATAETFSLTSNKAAGSDYPVASLTAGGAYATGTVFIHLLSNQVDGTTIPFKPGNTVVAWNGGLSTGLNNSGSPLMNLLGSPDLNTTLATGTYGAPLGPSGWVVIGTYSPGAPALLTIGYDWIAASGSTGTMILLQN